MINGIKSIVTASLFCLTFGDILAAKEYLVSNAAEIATAMSTAQPGDTLTMQAGIWQNQVITFHGNGSAEAPILLRVKIPGTVRLTGSSRLRLSGSWLVVDGLLFQNGACASGQAIVEFRSSWGRAQHCRLTNSVIINYNPSNVNTDYKWVSLYGQNNRVDHCHFEGKTHSGTTLVVWLESTNDLENYHLIDHNYFGPRPPLGFNGGETIRVGTSESSMNYSYTIVEYNVFNECNGETEIISNKSCGNIYRYNTFINCKGCLTLRHGNQCRVEGNFFFGNNLSGTGGVRIIGEDHQVFNNYFQDLAGEGYTSALCMVKGVVNSPLNRYFQVQRALVAFNTFINCRNTFLLGYGTDTDQTLPPIDCTIANNAVQTNSTVIKIGDSQGTPVNFTYQGNIFYGSSLGIADPGGITWQSPGLALEADGLYRPTINSPLINAAWGEYSQITTDMDGQPRVAPFDVGCDERSSAPRLITPLAPDDVRPLWFQPGPYTVSVEAGTGTLNAALGLVAEDDTLELVSDGGLYVLTEPLIVNRNVYIRSAANLAQQPILKRLLPASDNALLFKLEKGSLILKGVVLDGNAQNANQDAALITANSSAVNYKLKLDSCTLVNVRGNFFAAMAGSRADTLSFTNCLFSSASGSGLRLDVENLNSGKFNVRYCAFENCTFWNLAQGALSVYGGDEIPFTPGPYIRIDHCTFDDCGRDGTSVLNLEQVDLAFVSNSIFSNSPANPVIRLFGWSYIEYTDMFKTGVIELNRGATQKEGMVELDPEYRNPAAGDFTLSATSPVRGLAKDGKALGDLRWARQFSGNILSEPHPFANSLVLQGYYPNPFNATVNIRYHISRPSTVALRIYDLLGRQVGYYVQAHAAGEYQFYVEATELNSGVYLARLEAGDERKSFKIMLVR